MLMDIFSMFDPLWFNICYKSSILLMIMMLSALNMFWWGPNKTKILTFPVATYILMQLMPTKTKYMKSLSLIMKTLFMLILLMNITGMMPYLFSSTSHIMFTLSLALPMWLLLITSSIISTTKNSLAHLLPNGAPIWLNPFLVLIESISTLIRPITLSFRLAANMTAGHVVLSLIMSASTTKMSSYSLSMTMSMAYLIFELIICMIQSYIFCLLTSLYSNDHM